MSWITEEPATVDELCDALMRLSEPASAWACRGQGKAWGRLTPSIDRILESGQVSEDSQMAELEYRGIYVFWERANNYLAPNEAPLLFTSAGILLLMQHYGAPTRLLDWSLSPWVAAYFCVLSNTDEQGEIWAFQCEELERRTSSPLTNNVLFSPTGKILQQRRVDATPHDWLAMFRPTGMNSRMIAQQSVFTVASLRQDHDKLIDAKLPEGLTRRILVNPNIKRSMQQRLVSMNMTAAALFPGTDGLGQFVRQLTELWSITAAAGAAAAP